MAVAVTVAGSCGSGSTASQATSICCGCGPEKTKKKKKAKSKTKQKNYQGSRNKEGEKLTMRDGSDLRGRHPGWEEKDKEGKTHPPTGVPAHMLHAEPGSFQDVRLCRDESNLQDSTPCFTRE